MGYDFKASGKISHCCLTFSATNNTCLAIHLSKSHPVSGRLLALVMDSTWARSQVLCSAGMHGLRQQPFAFHSGPDTASCNFFLYSRHLTLSSLSHKHEGHQTSVGRYGSLENFLCTHTPRTARSGYCHISGNEIVPALERMHEGCYHYAN